MGDGRERVEEIDAKRYTINDIVRTLGLSRTTIMYYESLGIVTPTREGEQARRMYSDADMWRLMSAVLLKNVGISPKDLPGYLADQPFTAERCDEYARLLEHDIEYRQALLDRMRLYNAMCAHAGYVGLCDVPEYYFCPDAADAGYKAFPEDETLDLLIAHMPIGGLGSLREPATGEDADRLGGAVHWGRTVPVRFADLIDGLKTEGLQVIGGCTCVSCILSMQDIRRSNGISVQAHSKLLSYIDDNSLTICGPSFSPFSLPSDHGFTFPICVPVQGRDQA